MKNFIWDFDGTLYDSYPHIVQAFCRMLDNNGIPYDYREVQSAFQVTFGHAYKAYSLTEAQIDEFRKYADMYDFEPCIVPYTDAERMLSLIVEHGGTNFIFTHRDFKSLEYYLKKYGFDRYFKACVTSDDGFERKPSPKGIEYILGKYGLDRSMTVMIGDRELDVLSGVNAGVCGVLLAREEWMVPDSTSANYVFEDIMQIEMLL